MGWGWDGGVDGWRAGLGLRLAERGAAPAKSAASASKERGCGGNGGGRRDGLAGADGRRQVGNWGKAR